MTKVWIVVCLLAATILLLPPARARQQRRKEKAQTQEGKVRLELQLPKPMFVGTPKNLKSANLEAPRKAQCRPLFYVPAGVTNVARGSTGRRR